MKKPRELHSAEPAAHHERAVLLTKSFLLSHPHDSPLGRVLRIDDLQHRQAQQPLKSGRRGCSMRVLIEQLGEVSSAGIEVLADPRAHSGNLFIESIRDIDRGIPGWLWTSDAELLSYVFPARSCLVLLPLRTVRAWFEEQVDRFRRREVVTVEQWGARKSVGSLIPTNHLLAEVPGAYGAQREGLHWERLTSAERAPLRAVG